MSGRYRGPLWLTGARGVAVAAAVLWLLGEQMMKLGPEPASQSEIDGPAVFGWQEDIDLGTKPFPELVLRVSNKSELPVYDVKLRVPVGVRGTFVRELHSIEPKETQEIRVAIPGPPRSSRVMTELSFVDTIGRQWLRTATGELKQVEQAPLFDADPGAYSAKDHPTLHLQSEGRTVVS
jgi:hypothetical protein